MSKREAEPATLDDTSAAKVARLEDAAKRRAEAPVGEETEEKRPRVEVETATMFRRTWAMTKTVMGTPHSPMVYVSMAEGGGPSRPPQS